MQHAAVFTELTNDTSALSDKPNLAAAQYLTIIANALPAAAEEDVRLANPAIRHSYQRHASFGIALLCEALHKQRQPCTPATLSALLLSTESMLEVERSLPASKTSLRLCFFLDQYRKRSSAGVRLDLSTLRGTILYAARAHRVQLQLSTQPAI